MDIVRARTLNDQELVDEISTARRQLYDLRFQLATRQLTDYSQISRTRRSIARLLTVQTERARAARTPAASGAPVGAGGER
jgi:large subunit ribosomal protein L29